MAMTAHDRQRYALAHPVRTIKDVRQGHSARTKHRFQTVLTVELAGERPVWRVQVAFLSINWQPLPIVRWPDHAKETARKLGQELVDGVGVGEPREQVIKNTLVALERDLRPDEIAELAAPGAAQAGGTG